MANYDNTEIPSGRKVCKGCGIEKDYNDFNFEPRVRTKTTAQCKECIFKINKEWRLSNPEKVNESRKKYAARFPERIQAARNFTLRRIAIERKEERIASGLPLLEKKVTNDGRYCPECRRRKPDDEFAKNISGKDGYGSYCKDCTNRKGREQSKKPRTQEYRKAYMKEYDLKKYGITREDFQNLAELQNGKCAICNESLTYGTGGCSIDHDHETKKVRGLLCRLCNVGIGHFKEREDLFLKAIAYLKKHGK